LWDGILVVEAELAQFLIGSEVARLAVLALVLALGGYKSKGRGGFGGCWRVTDKFEQVAVVTTEIEPTEDNFAVFFDVNTEVQILVKQESFFVLVRGYTVKSIVLWAVFSYEFCFAFFVYTLDDELVLEFLAGASDRGSSVFEDEFRVAFERSGTDDI
jgi:hypothetical protein